MILIHDCYSFVPWSYQEYYQMLFNNPNVRLNDDLCNSNAKCDDTKQCYEDSFTVYNSSICCRGWQGCKDGTGNLRALSGNSNNDDFIQISFVMASKVVINNR